MESSSLLQNAGQYGILLVYLIPIALIWLWRVRHSRIATRRHHEALQKTRQAGLTEPASLHPLINRDLCIACNACAKACPEQDVLAIIHDKVELINPTHCIGHGACKRACPVDAITLVFGTEKRGVDIPNVNPSFETNIPGIFIAGELGGMGLIRNAITQGRQAMDAINKKDRSTDPERLDVVIIGAGPAGFSASLGAMKHKLRFVTLEQETLGGTVSHYPRGKVVMTQPAELPLVGKVRFRETTKEELMAFWEKIVADTGLKVNCGEPMSTITADEDGFLVTTPKTSYKTKNILLTIGRRGTPRKLGVPGEELPKVTYRLIDPAQYRNQKVLVVGGGDSALEAATSIADEPGTHVTISYRSDAFSRAKEKNRQKVTTAEAAGKLTVLMKSNTKEITKDTVVLDQNGKKIEIENDAIIVSAGGILPTGMLKELGIDIETKHGTA
ncbi:MAG TPA: 4Fe-4S dicluster domain-containing protein [Gammaproteobacteria bacterium]|nr:4Fe-4S dicluster domain-containing protein [Gammaproteobacteria bacterium]